MKRSSGDEDVTLQPTIEWIGKKPDTINEEYLEYGLREVIRSLFGEFGACSPLSVRSYDAASCRATLSVPADGARRVAAAFALCTELLGTPCVLHVHGDSPVQSAPKRYFA